VSCFGGEDGPDTFAACTARTLPAKSLNQNVSDSKSNRWCCPLQIFAMNLFQKWSDRFIYTHRSWMYVTVCSGVLQSLRKNMSALLLGWSEQLESNRIGLQAWFCSYWIRTC
jgi:hypothetical protein